MARSYDEAPNRPQEAVSAAEYLSAEESAPIPEEPMAAEEDRTFTTDRQPVQTAAAPAASKTKKLTVAAAIFAAAGITLFAGIAGTAELLRMQMPPQTTAVTETAEPTETSATTP